MAASKTTTTASNTQPAIGAALQEALAALLNKLGAAKADIDYKEEARRRLFAQQETNQLEAYPQALRASRINAADRGILQSGIALNQQGEINKAHFDTLGQLNTGLQNDVSQFARDRLGLDSQYKLDYADLLRQDALTRATNPTKPVVNAPVVAPPKTNPAKLATPKRISARTSTVQAPVVKKATTPVIKKIVTPVNRGIGV